MGDTTDQGNSSVGAPSGDASASELTKQMTEVSLNGLPRDTLKQLVQTVSQNPSLAHLKFYCNSNYSANAYNEAESTMPSADTSKLGTVTHSFPGFNQAGNSIQRDTPHTISHPMYSTSLVDSTSSSPVTHEDSSKSSVEPTQGLLHALSFCYLSSVAYHATLRGIPLDSLRAEASSNASSVSRSSKHSTESIHLQIFCESNHEQESQIVDLFEYAYQRSPVTGSLNYPVHLQDSFSQTPKDGISHSESASSSLKSFGSSSPGKKKPKLLKDLGVVKGESTWLGGGRIRSEFMRSDGTVRTLDADEPAAFLGGDAAPGGEHLLSSLGDSLISSTLEISEQENITISEISVNFEGDVDANGFLGTQKGMRSQFQNIRMKVLIVGNAEDAVLNQIWEKAKIHSPVMRLLSDGTTVRCSLQVNGKAVDFYGEPMRLTTLLEFKQTEA
mmetsp:Transcript_9645/g.17379  ORF Transcript_9645/g.17379 Transcript_9645/m.17379 type:complete len:444 (-) Transcript_9645:1318-2649(-)